MRSFYIKISIFLCLLFITSMGINRWIDSYVAESAELKYKHLMHSSVKENAIILGSSHAEAAINPKYLEQKNFNVYNYAFSGASAKYLYLWYKDFYLQYQKPPQYVFISIDWFMFDDDWLWRSLEHDSMYFSYKQFLAFIFKKGINKEVLFKRRFPLDRMHFSFIDMFLSKQKVLDYYKGHYSYTIAGSQSDDLTFDQKKFDYFIKLLDLLERNNSTVVFVQTPECHPWREEILFSKDKYRMDQQQKILAIARKRNIIYLNYNSDLYQREYNQRDLFVDWGHLNKRGSSLFSQQLALDLYKNFPSILSF